MVLLSRQRARWSKSEAIYQLLVSDGYPFGNLIKFSDNTNKLFSRYSTVKCQLKSNDNGMFTILNSTVEAFKSLHSAIKD